MSKPKRALERALKAIPPVDGILGTPAFVRLAEKWGRDGLRRFLQIRLDDYRAELRAGRGKALDREAFLNTLPRRWAGEWQGLCERGTRRVINGTGVLLHTNLGRANLSERARKEVAIAALLHDAVEDQGGSKVLGEIERRFGARAAAIVEGCSDWSGDGAKPPWRRRKEHHIARLAAAGPDVQLVAAADKLHNLRSLIADYRARGETVWPRFNGGRAGTLWYYRQVADALGAAGVPPALGEALAGAVDEIEGLAANVKRADRVEN